ncbi:MAG: glycosyltransferase [Owenweeksia sp.]|nr:glycosyltransferase [Owenweeksia sp.]MBF99202.1 glycosyltransferase [Owenweeksia sp.]|tara:strand:- start:3327 stop:4544 length:1218 start_codon:yes stop_codon:yes gene_type:complete
MDTIKVLMLGPGEPHPQNSGLGIAASHISRHLQQLVELTVIQPGTNPSQHVGSLKKALASLSFTEEELMADIIEVEARHRLDPYHYLSGYEVEERNTTNKATEKVSQIREVVEHFSEQVVHEGNALDFDVIYAHDWVTFSAALELKKRTKKPLVLHVHSLDYDRSGGPSGSWIYELEKEAMAQATAIIAVSQYTKNVIREYYEVQSPVYVIHNGYARTKSTPVADKIFPEKLILFVGRLSGQKGPGIFMQIAEAVHRKMPDTRFVMAGTGELLKQLIESGAYRSVSGKFHFTGHITHEQVEELFAMADVYCMPSVSEPFGLSAIEAAGAGIPVVLSKQSGAGEVLPGALKADYWDVETFTAHVISCLTDRKMAARSISANQDALRQLNWQNIAQSILRVLRDSLN